VPFPDRFLTPDAAPGPVKPIVLWVPEGDQWEQLVRGALVPLVFSESYEQSGAQSPEDTAAAFEFPLYLTFMWEGARVIGEILPYVGTTPPRFCLDCDGAAVSETTYAALFAVVAYSFGNPGGGNFNLPDLRGRVPVGAGAGASLTPRAQGDAGGEETHVLTADEMPSHAHSVHAHGVPVIGGLENLPVSTPAVTDGATGYSGGDMPHENMPPYLAVGFAIWTGVP